MRRCLTGAGGGGREGVRGGERKRERASGGGGWGGGGGSLALLLDVGARRNEVSERCEAAKNSAAERDKKK